MIIKILKKTFYFILGFIALILFYLLTCFVLSSIKVNEEKVAKKEIDIYLLTNGVHTDIVVPSVTEQVDWFSKLNHLKAALQNSDYKYLALGWGDKGFYLNTPTWAELKLSTALKATVGISGTAIHATYYKEMYEKENCVKISISKEQYSRLIKYLDSSFDLSEEGNFIQIETNANRGDLDAFYEATGRYSFIKTCNSWTNKGLKVSGQNACFWTAFQGPIFDKYLD